MLDYFAERGWIELKASGLVHGYVKTKAITDIEELTRDLHEYSMEREVGELSRLNELFAFFSADTCLSHQLSAHFGQAVPAPCGHCSACEGAAIGALPSPDYAQVGDSALTGLRRLRQEYPQQLADLRQQARFLCGLSSPKMVRARLTRHPLYGCCSGVPFEDVLEAVATL
jgi:ATP-dependent DNA helicase RecQ